MCDLKSFSLTSISTSVQWGFWTWTCDRFASRVQRVAPWWQLAGSGRVVLCGVQLAEQLGGQPRPAGWLTSWAHATGPGPAGRVSQGLLLLGVTTTGPLDTEGQS